MEPRRAGKRLGVGLLVLATCAGATGWYAATHSFEHPQHFDSCRVSADGIVTLDYTHGAGDKVTASMEPEASAIIVTLRLDRSGGPEPAIALRGHLQFDSFGGLRGRPVRHEDQRVIPCPKGPP